MVIVIAAELGKVFRVYRDYPPAYSGEFWCRLDRIMFAWGAAASVTSGFAVGLFQPDTLTAMAGLTVAFAGLVTQIMPYILRRNEAAIQERREARYREAARATLAAKMKIVHSNSVRIEGLEAQNDRQEDAVLALIELLRRVDDEKDKILSLDRQWMREAATKFNVPLPEGFGNRIFDHAALEVDLDDLQLYLTGEPINPQPEIVKLAQARVPRPASGVDIPVAGATTGPVVLVAEQVKMIAANTQTLTDIAVSTRETADSTREIADAADKAAHPHRPDHAEEKG